MADVFSDLFGAITGQQKAAPYTQSDTGALLAEAGPMAGAANIAYNNQLAPAYRKILLDNEAAFDPNAAALRQGTTTNILDQLNMGSSLPADLQQQVIQNALQGSAASGFGMSPGGRGLVARDLGLTGLDLLNSRINNAANYGLKNSQMGMSLYQPQEAFNPMEVAGGIGQDQANKQAHDVSEFARKEGNKIAMYNTFGRVAGSVIGGVYGGPMGAKMGGDIGGSLISNPYSSSTGAGNNGSGGGGANFFSSIFSGGGGGGAGAPVGGGIGGGASGASGMSFGGMF